MNVINQSKLSAYLSEIKCPVCHQAFPVEIEIGNALFYEHNCPEYIKLIQAIAEREIYRAENCEDTGYTFEPGT